MNVVGPPWWFCAVVAVVFAALGGVLMGRGQGGGIVLAVIAVGLMFYAQLARSERRTTTG